MAGQSSRNALAQDMSPNKRLCVLGECMLEVSAEELLSARVPAGLAYGGDTLNTALYFARMGGVVGYLTALGDDGLSSWMLESWAAEGIDCGHVLRVDGGAPGMYLIQVDERGERSFVYWREQSPARQLLQSVERLTRLLDAAAQHTDMFYLSGITLALMTPQTREAFYEFAQKFRAGGGVVAFDSNHRPLLWGDVELAKESYQIMYAHTDIALSTADDEYALFGGDSATDVIERLRSWGVDEIVVKNGDGGAILLTDSILTSVAADSVPVVDTTAAGDSFNAAYLFSRAANLAPAAAVGNGHALAGTVIGQRGAIIAADAMPALRYPVQT